MKVGIVADNYKVPMFEKELAKAGFAFEKMAFTAGSTTIRVDCDSKQVEQLHALCARVQSLAFHRN